MTITLSPAEIESLTGYEQPCKQLETLRRRGFYRAYIARKGGVVLERTHYEAVTRGQDAIEKPVKSANVSFMRKSA
jgi:hypothetical protein